MGPDFAKNEGAQGSRWAGFSQSVLAGNGSDSPLLIGISSHLFPPVCPSERLPTGCPRLNVSICWSGPVIQQQDRAASFALQSPDVRAGRKLQHKCLQLQLYEIIKFIVK